MSFPEEITRHLCWITLLAAALAFGALVSADFDIAILACLLGWLAFVVLTIFRHPPILR